MTDGRQILARIRLQRDPALLDGMRAEVASPVEPHGKP